MELDNIATPQEETTPELRYASLHRAVERGMASQDVFRELAEICLQLGHLDEAVRVYEGMEPGSLRDHVASRLKRRGLIAHSPATSPAPRSATARGPEAGPQVGEHVLDAVQYMAQGSMPAVALSTMLAFPLVVSAGGMVTGGSPWLFAALAAPLTLGVLGFVGAVSRQVYLRSAEGEAEAPALPAAPELLALGKRHLGDHLAVFGAYVAPAVIALLLGVPAMSMLPALLLGMFLAPMALVLRQHRGDFASLSPVTIVRGISCSRGYARLAGMLWLAFAPAAIAFWATLGHAPWIQLSVVGPLAVLPAFGAARVLGTFVDAHRERLGKLLELGTTPARAQSGASSVATTPQRQMRGVRPVGAQPQPAQPQAAQPRTARPATAAQPAPRSAVPSARIEGRAPKAAARPQPAAQTPRATSQQQPGKPQKPAQQQPAAQRAASNAQKGFEGPDLSGIPGATVISGRDRERMGAAAKKG